MIKLLCHVFILFAAGLLWMSCTNENSSQKKESALTLAIFDTGLCQPRQWPSSWELKVFSVAGGWGPKWKSPKKCPTSKTFERKNHGGEVLKTLWQSAKHYSSSSPPPLQVYAFEVYQKGRPSLALWKRGIKELKTPHLTLLAGQFPYTPKEESEPPLSWPKTVGVTLMATPTFEGSENPQYWPWDLAPPHALGIGLYRPSREAGGKVTSSGPIKGYFDTAQVRHRGIDYYLPRPVASARLGGSSWAVSVAAGLALTQCSKALRSFNHSKLKECLDNHSKKLLPLGRHWPESQSSNSYRALKPPVN